MFTIKNKEMLNTYNTICGLTTVTSRLNRGSCASLIEAGDGWLLKSDKAGFDLVPHEFSVLQILQESGMVPEVDEEEGVFGHPSSFYIRKINNAATIGDYCEAFLAGSVDADVFMDLMNAVSTLMNEFWNEGWVHGDLNINNIVIGMTRGGGAWRPYIIDTAFSFKEAEGNLGLDKSTIETVDEDKEYFLSCLREIDTEGDTDYEKALNLIN